MRKYMIFRVLFQEQGRTITICTYEHWNDMHSAIATWFRRNPENRARGVFIHHTEAV